MEGRYEVYIEGRKIKIFVSKRATIVSAFDHNGSRIDLTPSQYLIALTHTLLSESFRINGVPIERYPEVYFQSVYSIIGIVERISELEKKADSLVLPGDWSSMNPREFSGLLHKLLDQSP